MYHFTCEVMREAATARGAARRLTVAATLLMSLGAGAVHAQDASGADGKRIWGIIPNNRTSPTLSNYEPLRPPQKVRMAADDAFDRGSFVLAGLFAGYGQLVDAAPAFGAGVPAYARYYAASFADLGIGDFMTEAILPIALRQDPRYFQRGTGSVWRRIAYAAGQTLITHGDSGRTQFNASEWVGNAAAVAIGTAYYPGSRSWSSSLSKIGLQIGTDAAANIVKEFTTKVRPTR